MNLHHPTPYHRLVAVNNIQNFTVFIPLLWGLSPPMIPFSLAPITARRVPKKGPALATGLAGQIG